MVTVLIIDDELSTQLVLQRALAGQEYDVVVAGDGLEGLEMAKALRPALIICDWVMPRMDGLEVCRQIKASPDLCTTFFILLTSRTAVEDRVLGLDNGADDFLSKPIEVNELQARVRAGLRLQRINQDLQAQKQMLETEFGEAAAYVRSLLPQNSVEGGIQMDSRFVPSRQLGGDCFDYFWLDPDYLVIYLLDVSGHGLGAALPSISVLNMLRTQTMDGVNFYQPSHVLYALNESFQMDLQNDKYFTIWYGVYNRVKRQLIYSSAGHPPAVLVTGSATDKTVQQLKTSSLPIGMLPDTRFSNQRCDIGELSTLYIFSDGIYEILQPDGTIWGLDNFVRLLAEDQALIQQKGLDHILNHVKQLNLGDALDDDLSLLRIEFN